MAVTGDEQPREQAMRPLPLPEGFRLGPSVYWHVGPDPLPPTPSDEAASLPDWVREREARDAAARAALDELAWLQQQQDLLEARAIAARATLASIAVANERNLQHQQLELRSMARELGARMTVGHGTARRWLDQASEMTDRFPAVHAALADGRITTRQATVIVASGAVLTDSDVDEDKRAKYCETAITRAEGRVPGKLAEITTKLAERFVSRPITVRHRAAVADRHVEVTDLDDGMAAITAVLPDVQAHAIHDRLVAGSRRKCKSDPRTASQWRADAFARLLITGRISEHGAPGEHSHGGHDLSDDGHDAEGRCLEPHGDESCGDPVVGIAHCDEPSCTPATINGITPSVAITVPALSLAFDDDWLDVEPAMLEGRRPMSLTTAACMIESGKQELQRWITHPISGQVVAVDSRFANAQLRREISARDGGRCRQSSCSGHHGLQHDHGERWVDGGPTALHNAAGLCTSCHIVKDNTAWSYELTPAGDVDWTSPLGYRHRDRPIPASDPASWPPPYDAAQWDDDEWDADETPEAPAS